jgi:folate-dependent phosphoribosylglycinamide formyltransferase PurN
LHARGAVPFTVVIVSSTEPSKIARLIRRIANEAAEVSIGGVLYETRTPKTLARRMLAFSQNLRDPLFYPYVLARLRGGVETLAGHAIHRVLRFAHAAPGGAAEPVQDLKWLTEVCSERDIPILVTPDVHGEPALDWLRARATDLGIVYGTRILKPVLYSIPALGSINIHQRKVPEYRGGGAIGLWEMLDGQSEIGITVHRVAEAVDTGAVLEAATVAIQEFDTLNSLALKAQVVGNDLLIRTIRMLANGTARELPQCGAGRTFKSPSPQALHRHCRDLARTRRRVPRARTRSAAKLAAKTLLLAPFAVARNWRRRFRARFPIVILYHHLVADRATRYGITTDAFARHVHYLRKHYRLVSLADAVKMLASGSVPYPTAVLHLTMAMATTSAVCARSSKTRACQ